MPKWAVVMTKPNSENLATANLCQQGFTTYLPRFQYHRPDHTIQVKPLFPRYVFTLIERAWYQINGTYGVSYVLQGNDGPATIPQSEIDHIRALENSKGFIVLPGVAGFEGERFTKNQVVKTTSGPLQGLRLIYQGMTGRDRVKVLMDMLGRETTVTLQERLLVAA